LETVYLQENHWNIPNIDVNDLYSSSIADRSALTIV